MIKKEGKVIAEGEKYCRNWFSQSLGLMFSKKKILVFCWKNEAKRPIHMFFVFFCIDVFYLDKNRKIIETAKKVKPFSFYNPSKKAVYLIESPAGLLKIKTKDVMEFIEE